MKPAVYDHMAHAVVAQRGWTCEHRLAQSDGARQARSPRHQNKDGDQNMLGREALLDRE